MSEGQREGRAVLPTVPLAGGSGEAVAITLPAPALRATRPWYLDVWVQMLRRKPLGTVGGVIVILMLSGAVLADVITPYGFAQTSLRERLMGASSAHWLGTDQLGRDLLTRLLYGARISLYVGFGAVTLGSVLATVLGIGSAYFGGRVDLLLQRMVDAWMAFPGLLLLMSIMSLVGPGAWNITLVLGIAFGIQNSRIVRGVALSIKEYTYIE
ncbi:MAG: ABC transporter permease, partial [Tepidiformaceae bacterium]